MSTEYVGTVVLEVDGREIDVVSVNASRNVGRKPVRTMNRKGKSKGFTKTVADYSLRLTAVVPEEGNIDWDGIENAKVTIDKGPAGRESYLGCFSIEVGESYDVDNEARVDISMGALDFVRE